MLRDGRRIRLRTPPLRDLHARRRARPPAEGTPGVGGYDHHRRRIQLPGADCASDRTPGAASVAGSADGAAHVMRYRPIAEYGIIGDTRSAALISLQGS